jgi:hypothetical protein
VTLLLDRVPAKLRGLLEWWCLAAAFGLSLYIAWYAIRLVWVSYTTHDVACGRCHAAVDSADQHGAGLHRLRAGSFGHALIQRWQGSSFIAVSADAAHVE